VSDAGSGPFLLMSREGMRTSSDSVLAATTELLHRHRTMRTADMLICVTAFTAQNAVVSASRTASTGCS
jgi:hypothetical protein